MQPERQPVARATPIRLSPRNAAPSITDELIINPVSRASRKHITRCVLTCRCALQQVGAQRDAFPPNLFGPNKTHQYARCHATPCPSLAWPLALPARRVRGGTFWNAPGLGGAAGVARRTAPMPAFFICPRTCQPALPSFARNQSTKCIDAPIRPRRPIQ